MSEDNTNATVHWVVAGQFGPTPSGQRHTIDPYNFAEILQTFDLSVDVAIPDRFGTEPTRTFTLKLPSLKAFRLEDVVKQVPALADLKALADDLGHAGRRPAPDALLTRLREAVGDGRFLADAARLIAPPPSTPNDAPKPAETKEASEGKDDAIDAIFAQAEVKPEDASPKAAVDAFIQNIRQNQEPKTPATASRKVRRLLEDAVYGTAADILRAPEVVTLEAAWRGLKLLVDQCGRDSGMRIELIDTTAENALELCGQNLPDEDIDRPSAFFITDSVAETSALEAWAEFGETQVAPVVVHLHPNVFGDGDLLEMVEAIEAGAHPIPEAYQALRKNEASRWLAATVNRFVAFTEGAGEAQRTVFASPTLGTAALLASVYRNTGAFGQFFGHRGALASPGVYTLSSGLQKGNACPTERYLSVRASARLAHVGVTGLGSRKNSDQLELSAAPTLRKSSDAVPLPAQIVTGRAVRFTQWVRDQIVPGTSDEDVKSSFEQLAKVFLFPGVGEAANLDAQVIDDAGERRVSVRVQTHGSVSGIGLDLEFSLGLPR